MVTVKEVGGGIRWIAPNRIAQLSTNAWGQTVVHLTDGTNITVENRATEIAAKLGRQTGGDDGGSGGR